MPREITLDDATVALLTRYRDLRSRQRRDAATEVEVVMAIAEAMLSAVPTVMWVANVYYDNGTKRHFDVTRKMRDVIAENKCDDDCAKQHVEDELAQIYTRAVIEVEERAS